jgi:MFS family permease
MAVILPALTPTLERGQLTAPVHHGPARTGRLRASLDASIAEGAAAEVFGACAGGAVLTGWALYLGASAVTIGLLTALPVAAQVVQLPAAWLTQRFGAKRLAVAAVGASRLVWLPLIAVPFVHLAPATALTAFVAIVTIATILGVVGGNAWTAWMGDLIPGSIRGRFFGRRMVFLNIAGTMASLGAGLALDTLGPRGFKGETLGVLLAVACAAGLISVWMLVAQQGPGPREDLTAPEWGDFARSIQDAKTRPLLAYLLAWHAAVGISAGFFSYHMLANLKMGFVLVAAHGILAAAVRIASAPVWGRLVDAFGARPVLIVCSSGISVVPVIWLFITPDRLWPIAIEAVLAGALWGGHGIATMDLSIGLAPRRGRPFYLATFATAGGLGFAVTSALAGVLAYTIATPVHVLGSTWLDVHVLFVLSALGRAGAARLATRIDEPAARSVQDLGGALVGMLESRSMRCHAGPPPSWSAKGGHHLVGEDAERPQHQLHREQPAGIQLGDHAVQPQILAQPAQALHQLGGGAEGDAPLENLRVRQLGDLIEERDVAIGRTGVGTAEPGTRELGVAPEEVGDVLVRLVDGSLVGRRRVDGDPQAHVAVAGVARIPPGGPIAAEVLPECRDIEIAKTDEERQTEAADEAERLR